MTSRVRAWSLVRGNQLEREEIFRAPYFGQMEESVYEDSVNIQNDVT